MTDDDKRIDRDDASPSKPLDESGNAAKAGLSASRTGDRSRDDDLSDIGGTEEMGSETGGLAGTSR